MTNMQPIAYGYCRISHDPRKLEKGIKRQRADVREMAARLNADLVTIFEDNDVSASKARNEGTDWQRLLDRLRSDPPDYLIAYKGDRISRDTSEWELIYRIIKKTGTKVLNTEGWNIFGPGWRHVAATAADEAENTGNRVARAHAERRKQGLQPNGGRRPFGFKRDRVRHKPAEVRILRDVAARIIAGETTTSVVRWLNETGVPTTSGGGVWQASTLKQVLRNPRYVGQLARVTEDRKGYEVVGPAAWEPVLDRETWEALQQALDERKHRHVGRPKKVTLLGGVARCAACSKAMFAHQGGTKDHPLYYYRCSKAIGGCGRVSRRRAELDEYVVQYVLANVDAFALKAERERRWAEVKRLRTESHDLANQIEDIKDALDRTRRPAPSVVRRLDELEEDLRVLHRQIGTARLAAEQVETETATARWLAGTDEDRRLWLERYVDFVWVAPTDRPRDPIDPATIDVQLKTEEWTEDPGTSPGAA